MFTELINNNQPMPDPRAGSSPAISAYSAACLASQNITLPPPSIALALPDSWAGPLDIVMGLPGTIITVIIGAGLGGSAIFLLSNM